MRKKAMMVLLCLLLVLTVFYPSGVVCCGLIGCTFELTNAVVFEAAVAGIAFCLTILSFVWKESLDNWAANVILLFLLPMALIQVFFFAFVIRHAAEALLLLSAAGCDCLLLIKNGKPSKGKKASLIVSGLMLPLVVVICFCALFFGKLGYVSVVETIDSPKRGYYAEVLDVNQGALGGDTAVRVQTKSELDLMLVRIKKKAHIVYQGKWGEFNTLQVHWKDEHCLVINSAEYAIE